MVDNIDPLAALKTVTLLIVGCTEEVHFKSGVEAVTRHGEEKEVWADVARPPQRRGEKQWAGDVTDSPYNLV